MGAKSAVISPGKISDKAVRQQLTRILVSKTFAQVDRLKRFVDFIVTETVEGRSGDLKEYVIGVQVLGKEASFDPRTDPIIRVQARRPRTRLERCYQDEGNADDIVVALPSERARRAGQRGPGSVMASLQLGQMPCVTGTLCAT